MNSSRFKTHYQTRVEEVIDPSSGELVQVREIKTTKINSVSPGDFIMAYTAFWTKLYGISSEGAFRLFSWLCLHINYGSTKVVLNASYKKGICKELDISMVSFIKYMKILKNFKISGERGLESILKEDNGIVVINPKFVWKGDPRKLADYKITVEGIFDQKGYQPDDDIPEDFFSVN